MQIDFYAENYIQNSRGEKKFPTFVGTQNKKNDPSGANSYKSRQRIPLRFKIGVMIDGKEYLTPALLETNIFICPIKENDGKTPNDTQIGKVKLPDGVGDDTGIASDGVYVISFGKI